MTTIARLVFLTALLGLFSAPLMADGLPPSEETVCDALNADGVTPGLFGLCNAYCEAKDCDEYPEGEEPRSCNRLLANYERRAGDSDPVMPCLADPGPTCPCWTPGEFADGGDVLSADTSFCIDDGPDPIFVGVDRVVYDDGTDMITFTAGEGGHPDFFNQDGCEYVNTLTDKMVQLLTDEDETAVCRADVDALIAADFGLPCDVNIP